MIDRVNIGPTIRKLVITGILIDCDVSAGGTYCEISDNQNGVSTPKITFNALFYKGFYLDLASAPPEFFGYLEFDNKSALTGRISLTLIGFFENL